jgi:hypothetical protein
MFLRHNRLKFYPIEIEFQLNVEDWESILLIAKEFLPTELKNKDDLTKSLNL